MGWLYNVSWDVKPESRELPLVKWRSAPMPLMLAGLTPNGYNEYNIDYDVH